MERLKKRPLIKKLLGQEEEVEIETFSVTCDTQADVEELEKLLDKLISDEYEIEGYDSTGTDVSIAIIPKA